MTPSRFALARLAFVEGVAVVALRGTAPLADVGPLARATTTQLSAALAWWGAAAITAWLVVTTLACVASRAVPALRALRLFDALTAPGVRRIVDGALACTLAAGTPMLLAAPSAARTSTATAAPPVVYVAPNGEVIVSPSTTSTSTAMSTSTTTATTTSTTAPSPRPTAAQPAAPPATHVVVPGENLWTIAAARLGTRRAAAIAPYWRRVVERNRPTLRSGDPNLIYPGEVIALPGAV
jgi:hypothetical protein